MEVFTRWANDPDYCDQHGRPRVLDRVGEPGSFEALAACASRDVHPHTLLQELIRLGVVSRTETGSNGGVDKISLIKTGTNRVPINEFEWVCIFITGPTTNPSPFNPLFSIF
jgi:hypothetical protein